MLSTRIGVGCLALLLAARASAGALEPKKASEVVTLTPSGAACPALPQGVLLDRQVNADGATTPFTIPPKRVLVVTALEVGSNSLTAIPNHSVAAALGVGTGPYGTPWFLTARIDADGAFSIRDAIPSGIVVRAGSNLCMVALDVTAGNAALTTGIASLVHGFLASDK